MIQLTCKHNIKIFNSFSDKYLKFINEIHGDNTISIGIINSEDSIFNCVASLEDPFASSTIMNPVVIAINEEVCIKLKLTQEEQHAMLAHEIGHILDKTQRLPNDQLIREYNADQFAIDLGLSQELKSGLEKIINSGDYSNENLDIKERIKKLS